MDFLLYILSGAAVGLAVGLTGVGGGSLMTPLLLLFGFPAHIAIGTDLLYAAITKASGVIAHQKQKTVDWKITGTLALGSLPVSIVTVWLLANYFPSPESYASLLTHSLGVMLILTAGVLLMKGRIRKLHDTQDGPVRLYLEKHKYRLTLIMGTLLGFCVTVSSVGAGAFGAAILLTLFPALSAIRIIGTDLAHAVPLTLIAGAGHMYLGNVDYQLLGALLIGSLPAIHLGTKLSSRLPNKVLQPILSSMLLGLGIKYAFF
ncbi:sulfite exporter TauE/SafE family protein [Oceanospirillum beijerinckii]|uniref:sulfite exporter TauE/SafE family protein n=1 Tax=Oceanospirillum beijerinckii TaxID=64976 RepID=UPI000421267A|nr:sulfite exporter TauE/SafE family protein [Oceanospirillum beijerinckii]MAC47344.1 sulfite exporter TauE/SafE family protein [Oceanospirillum sp.]